MSISSDQNYHNDPQIKPVTSDSSSVQVAVKALRPLSPRHPLDYLRLFSWVLIRPDLLKAYRAHHDQTCLWRVGSWLTSTLIWWPMFVWLAWPWYQGNLGLTTTIGAVLLLGIILAWLVTGLLGARHGRFSNVMAALTTLATATSVMTAVSGMTAGTEPTLSALVIGFIVIITTMVSVTMAALLNLPTAETVSGVVAVTVWAGVVSLSLATIGIGLAIIVAMSAVMIILGVEDRHHTQSKRES